MVAMDRKLRILILAPCSCFKDCGEHVRIYEEARSLVRRGHMVRIVSYDSGRDMPDIKIDRITPVGWLKKLPLKPAWCKPYMDFILMKQALKSAGSFRPHLIHAHHHQGARIGAALKKRLGIPLLFDCQQSLTAEMIDSGVIRTDSIMHRYLCRQEKLINAGPADHIIASSAALARNLISQWGVAENSVSTLTDGVNTALFMPHQREEARAKLKIPQGAQLVVYLGALNRSQGIDTLLSAIVQLKSRGSNIRFMIMGDGDEPYRAMAQDLGIERMIIFTGAIDYLKAPLYLSVGDVAVSPKISLNESNSKLLNYMACGLPTVAFDMPVNRELLGDAGIYAEYGDCSDLAAKLTALMENSEERIRLGALGITRAERLHTCDARGADLDEIYRVKLKR